MKKTLNAPRPFSFRDKLGYLLGDFGNDFTFLLSSSFLLKFYTDVMGLDAYVVGIVMMITRFIDGFTDVTMGRICDRSPITPKGKFKPWLLRMCVPVAIASFLIYQSSLAGLPYWAKVIYLFVTYTLWGSVFYTSINIPYGSMASAISPEPGDRQSLSTYRTMGGVFAGVIIGAGIPIFAFTKNEAGFEVLNGPRFTLVAGILSILSVIAYIACYFLTTERVMTEQAEHVKQDNNVGRMLLNALKNRAFISLIAASVVMLLAQLTVQGMAPYLYPNYYNSSEAQSVSTIVMMLGMFIAAAIAKPLANRFGKAEVSVAANLAAAAVYFILFLWRPQNVWVFVIVNAVCWVGLGIFSMISWAFVTDVIDYSEIKNGVREDGSVYALYSFSRKLGQAASAGLTGALLSIIGYSEATAFEPSVLEGIFSVSTIVPTIGFVLLALILWFWYPLHKKQVDQNVETLKIKHGRTGE